MKSTNEILQEIQDIIHIYGPERGLEEIEQHHPDLLQNMENVYGDWHQAVENVDLLVHQPNLNLDLYKRGFFE